MIFTGILEFLISILAFFVDLLPTLETPLWLSNSLPQIYRTIMGFNLYLPVFEALRCVGLSIGFFVGYRVISVIASFFNVDL